MGLSQSAVSGRSSRRDIPDQGEVSCLPSRLEVQELYTMPHRHHQFGRTIDELRCSLSRGSVAACLCPISQWRTHPEPRQSTRFSTVCKTVTQVQGAYMYCLYICD